MNRFLSVTAAALMAASALTHIAAALFSGFNLLSLFLLLGFVSFGFLLKPVFKHQRRWIWLSFFIVCFDALLAMAIYLDQSSAIPHFVSQIILIADAAAALLFFVVLWRNHPRL